ncbi:MAG: GNAT family N-acetyltransferase [Janthinobacterium lividum]
MEITQLSVQIDTDKPTAIYVFAHNVGPQPIGLLRLEINEPGAGWIGAVFVEEEYRSKGVGKELIGRAITICQELDKNFVSLTVADKNEGAQRLYKSLGFAPFMTGHEGYMQYVKPLK